MNMQPVSANATPGQVGAPASEKLVKSAREFESILLQSWLEKMNKSFIGAEDSQDPAHDTVSSLGTQAISQALSARGGIGIAAMVLRQLQTKSPASPAAHSMVSVSDVGATH